MKNDYLYYPRSERAPRVRGIGDKKGHFPMREKPLPKSGLPEGSKGVVGRTKGGYVQSSYCLPSTAPVHMGKDGKLYSSCYHAWKASSAAKKRGSSKPRATVDQPEVFGTTPRGRAWANACTIEEKYPKD